MKQTNPIKFYLSFLLALLALSATACGGGATPPNGPLPPPPPHPPVPTTITLMSYGSFDVSAEVIALFEQANNAKVEFVRGEDTGSTLNQAILAKGNPMADVFFGVDNTFFSRAIENEIFEPYDSPLLADIPDEFELDGQHRLLPVDFGDVCLNYDKGWFTEKGLAPPATLEDLLKAEYAGLTVVENPATSSPGLAFLMTTVAHFGDPGYLEFWQKMVAQDVLVVEDWDSAYYEQFTRYGGTRPIVVSYASSPPAEVYFAEKPMDEAPTASIIGDKSCFRQIEFVGILAGTPKRALAEKLVDFLLSQPFQEDIPLKMFVFPVNQKAVLPEVFQKYAQLAPLPATMLPSDISDGRELWINSWNEIVLR